MSKTMRKVALSVIALSLSAAALTGCAAQKAAEYEYEAALDFYNTEGGTAVIVNGVEMGESAVAAYIADFREQNDLVEDDAFAQWMGSSGYTPETLRQAVIDIYTNQEIIRQAAAENGIEVTEEDVDKALAKTRAEYSDSRWESILRQIGFTEQEYREQLRLSLMQSRLYNMVTGTTEMESQVNEFLSKMAEAGGGELAELLKAGFDKLNESNAANAIKADDDLLLMVIGSYDPDYAGAQSLSQIPEEVVETYRPYADQVAQQQAFEEFMAQYEADSAIEVIKIEGDVPAAAAVYFNIQPIAPADGEAADAQAAAEGAAVADAAEGAAAAETAAAE